MRLLVVYIFLLYTSGVLSCHAKAKPKRTPKRIVPTTFYVPSPRDMAKMIDLAGEAPAAIRIMKELGFSFSPSVGQMPFAAGVFIKEDTITKALKSLDETSLKGKGYFNSRFESGVFGKDVERSKRGMGTATALAAPALIELLPKLLDIIKGGDDGTPEERGVAQNTIQLIRTMMARNGGLESYVMSMGSHMTDMENKLFEAIEGGSTKILTSIKTSEENSEDRVLDVMDELANVEAALEAKLYDVLKELALLKQGNININKGIHMVHDLLMQEVEIRKENERLKKEAKRLAEEKAKKEAEKKEMDRLIAEAMEKGRMLAEGGSASNGSRPEWIFFFIGLVLARWLAIHSVI